MRLVRCDACEKEVDEQTAIELTISRRPAQKLERGRRKPDYEVTLELCPVCSVKLKGGHLAPTLLKMWCTGVRPRSST